MRIWFSKAFSLTSVLKILFLIILIFQNQTIDTINLEAMQKMDDNHNMLALLHVLLNGFYFILKCYNFSFIPIRDSSICSMRFKCLLITKIVRSMMRPSTIKWTLKILWSHDFMQVFSLWMSMTFRVQILISHCNYQIIEKFKPNNLNPPPRFHSSELACLQYLQRTLQPFFGKKYCLFLFSQKWYMKNVIQGACYFSFAPLKKV